MIELSRDPLQVLRKDCEFVLSRGRRKSDRLPLLVVATALEHAAPASLRQLEHAYELRESLDSTWAARPVALVHHHGRLILLLEDPGGEVLESFLGHPLGLTLFLRLAIGLAVALGRMHGRDVIHKDIKPSNVLANPATGEVWLLGFGIASRLPRERQSPEPPEFIAGTLPYMAPEQTGRMNRPIDSRSDLYSFGVTLYEMLTGSLPFMASDPMEWVHCLIAKQPVPPGERVTNIPGPISAIIMKLLAKTAEERYQTAGGVEHDLRRCLDEWETRGRVDEFRPGEHDLPDRLLISEKLYGRGSEVETLFASFDRVVAAGRPELVLVSGYSGIGKSSVVNELHKALVPPRGLFASGKFDQYKRDIPYATLAQAFQSLLRPLLTKSEAELSKWRDALREALDPNGQLIADLVPQLNLIIGEQPPVPDVSAQDLQARFQLVFRRFINVFARPEHPLALFLDDLQWLDTATLELLDDLLTQSDVRHLMLIGAYRDNEVDVSHPLMRKLQTIRQAGATIHEIVLRPLTIEDLELLLVDSVHCQRAYARPLAQLIHEKTTGNPFFAIQFISSLTEEGLLIFDHGNVQWSWDLNRIRAKGYTDNVVDLLIDKLNRLPIETQKALQLLACIGNSAEFVLLETVSQYTTKEVHDNLWEAVRAGLVFRTEDSYRFLHDRVQEAAYSLIPERSRAEVHLNIGRLLNVHTPSDSLEERIFEIVNQLNRGAALISAREERERLAELNLIAGTRAKDSTAYASALKYFVHGTALLEPDVWERRHELIFSLELRRAECEFLIGELVAAEQRLAAVLAQAANIVERARVTCLQVELYTTLDRTERAVAVCLDCLRHLGINWSPHPTREEARAEYERILSLLGSREDEELIELPLMSDPASLATLNVLTKLLPPALFTDRSLVCLAICRAVVLSLEQGHSDGSCVAYGWLGQIAGPYFGNYNAGFRFGLLGYELVEKRGLTRFQARTYMALGAHVMPWAKHVTAGRHLLQRSFEISNRIGDLCYAAFSRININTNMLSAGDPLPQAQQEAESSLEFARKTRFGFAINVVTVQLEFIRTLRGLTEEFGQRHDDQPAEFQSERKLDSNSALTQVACVYWIRKLQSDFLAGNYASALDASLRAEQLLWSIPSNLEIADYHYYGALASAASWGSPSSTRRHHGLAALTAHHRQLEIWAETCPSNFENRAALVGAEIARIEGRVLDAEGLYEQAIHSAQENRFVHNEAVAYEIAARFYAARGFGKIADGYLREARYGYLRWGADAKVRQLDELHPHLRVEEQLSGPTRTIVAPVELLDLATIIKVSQAVSSEIVLEKLIETLMRSAIEHAGANRGLLILPRGDELQLEAEATTGGDTVIVHLRQAPVAPAALPESILHYVVRTQENVILDDASARNPFSSDTYIVQHHARSILCLPLINQGKLIGVLYLENNLTPHVFTPTRIAVLKVLASQAAISLENTRLYRDLEQRFTEQKRAEAEIRALKDQLYRENLALRDEVDRASMFEETVGNSKPLQAVLSRIAKVAPTDSTVFITGETGTGKELIARAVHKRSHRSGRAFVSVNCAALAPSLISSELFGHEKGAFTGAMQRRLGRFELADGGTIFLDEVGELPPDMQVALLRVLQEREFERVGGAQSIRVDVRVIAATNRDLTAAIASGSFRQDLFYRLNVFPIEMPPLRERKEDILLLLEYFVKRYASQTGKAIRSIDKKTLELFQSYDWPGNIRELQNVVERSVILSSGDVFSIDESWLYKESTQPASRAQTSQSSRRERSEREVIEAALAESRGRVSGPSGAAGKLRIPPSTLERRIKALNIRKSQFQFG